MATLPVMGYVVGSAAGGGPVARLQAHWGASACSSRSGGRGAHRRGRAVAVSLGSFWGVLAATVLAGFYNANAQLYHVHRARELVAPQHKAQAISRSSLWPAAWSARSSARTW